VTTNALDAWTLLADPSRRSIIEALSAEPSSVTDLARALPISRPAVSQHLKLLKRAGVVTDRAAGTRRIYSVDADQLERYRVELDRFWGSTLENFSRLGRPEAPDHEEEP
jgi:DNA-binding transcriptional ArsR family regulator